MRGDLFCHIGCDNRFDHHGCLGHLPVLQTLGTDIIQEQNAGLISGKQPVLAFGVAHSNAHTVAVRVCCQQQLRLILLCAADSKLQRLPNLRIRIRAGLESAVGKTPAPG